MAERVLYCSRCGAQNDEGAAFCQKCGASLGLALAPPPATYAQTQTGSWPGYGGFWIRFVAFIVDLIIVRLAVFPFAAVLAFFGLRHQPFVYSGHIEPADIPAIAATFFATGWVYAIINWLYEALMTSSAWQGTVGKKLLNLKVTDDSGNRISFPRATGRHFAKYLSYFLFIGFIMAAFTDRKRALHDMIAGTLVKKG